MVKRSAAKSLAAADKQIVYSTFTSRIKIAVIAAISHDNKRRKIAVIAAITAKNALQNSLYIIATMHLCDGVSRRMGQTRPPSIRVSLPITLAQLKKKKTGGTLCTHNFLFP
nr:MAG TPA: hypothetical protein [Caudoviricetes sp.]